MPVHLTPLTSLDHAMGQTFATPQLLRLGTTKSELRRWCRDGEATRIRRGAVRLGPDVDAREHQLDLIAVTMPLLREGSVLSHWSAAAMWGMPMPARRETQVWVTRGDRIGAHSRTVLHVLNCPVPPEDVAFHDGMLLTTPARTVVDLARKAGFKHGVRAADAVLHRRLCDTSDLEAALVSARGRPGVSIARAVVAFADGRSESPGESDARILMARAGIPSPVLQFTIRDPRTGRFVARCDFAWPAHRLVGEYDGASKYGALLTPGQSPSDAVLAEKRREAAIRDAGWWIIRWTKEDLRDQRRFRDGLLRALRWRNGGLQAA